ncbi:hypothetical protein ACOQFV_24540 [Nocardiopsis changdeensis]|uniref:GPP34 family phosphoprotein n=1 Tax=Nocardiopsis changdeensis TaxID=2831969 RepID=A0A975QCM2_9ACTN|nr:MULTISPECIES: hypothetical protein [Nocardiopsis]QUX26440.1 hypothetical protein KGD84_32600 [Nocardiopsis changdeensis]QYX40712.1 hypothetical protein K1J57_32450 [Nocardiopsis sp. MT53]
MQHPAYSTAQAFALMAAATHPLGEVPQPIPGLEEQGLTFRHPMVEGEGRTEPEWLTGRGWDEAQRLHRQTGFEAPGRLGKADRLRLDLINEERRMEALYLGGQPKALAFGLLCVDNAIKYPTNPRDPWYRLESRLERSVRSRALNEALKQINGGVDVVESGGFTDVARELIAQVVIHLDDGREARSLARDADMPEAIERREEHRRARRG